MFSGAEMKIKNKIEKFYEGINNSKVVPSRIGKRFGQDGQKPVMVIAPFVPQNSTKNDNQILKEFLYGLKSEELFCENVCIHYFLPFPMRMTYREFLDGGDLLIRPKGVTQADFLNALANRNICNKLSLECVRSQKKILAVDYLPEKMDYEFVQNAANYLVEAHKAIKKLDFDEYCMRNNYIDEQLLGVDYLKKVIDIVQPNTIIFTDRKTRTLVLSAFENKKGFEKYVEEIKTRIRKKEDRIEHYETFLKMESSKKYAKRYKQYVRDWYERARDWDLTSYIENREAEASRENGTFGQTFNSYLSGLDCRARELDGFDEFLEKNEPVIRVLHPTTKSLGNREEALFEKLKRDLGAALKKEDLYEKYKSQFECHARKDALDLVSKLKENSADAVVTDEDIDTILSGLYPEKFSVSEFELWKRFIDNLEEPSREGFLKEFRGVVALKTEQKPTAEPSSEHPPKDKNARLKLALKSENRIHRLFDLDGCVIYLGSRIDNLRNYVGNDEEEKFIEKNGLLEFIEEIQDAQEKIAEIIKKMEELGDAREVLEEPKKTGRNTSGLQGSKKDAHFVLGEKMKKQ